MGSAISDPVGSTAGLLIISHKQVQPSPDSSEVWSSYPAWLSQIPHARSVGWVSWEALTNVLMHSLLPCLTALTLATLEVSFQIKHLQLSFA